MSILHLSVCRHLPSGGENRYFERSSSSPLGELEGASLFSAHRAFAFQTAFVNAPSCWLLLYPRAALVPRLPGATKMSPLWGLCCIRLQTTTKHCHFLFTPSSASRVLLLVKEEKGAVVNCCFLSYFKLPLFSPLGELEGAFYSSFMQRREKP